MKMTLITIILLAFLSSHVDSAKILYLYHLGCRSTISMHQTISKILLQNHHEIYAISPLPMNNFNHVNYTDLGAHDDFLKFIDEFSLEDGLRGTLASRKVVYVNHIPNCDKLYQNVKLIQSLKNIEIDLVLLEIDSAECFLPFVAQFQAPIIGITTPYFLFPDLDGIMGNPVNPSYVPIPFSELSTKMDFFQRLKNTKDYILHLLINWYYTYQADTLVAKYMKSPPIRELYDRISLVFSNNHFSFVTKPKAPSTVDIGGIHIGNSSPLPKEIQTFIDDSKEDVIFVSLGTVAAFSKLPKNMHDSFSNVLQKLPYRVIWRHDKPEMVPHMSKNLLVRKWFPQNDILAHPKVVLFISHSGIYSTFEAIHFGVPLLTFPVLYDQFTNAAIIRSLEIGLPLDLYNFNEQTLASGIDQVVRNKKYKENSKKLSNVFRDRPTSPQDTLIYWVNYVLKHKDVSYLKPTGAKLPFHQYLLLDVMSFLTFTLILISCVIYIILKTSTSMLRRSLSSKLISKSKTS